MRPSRARTIAALAPWFMLAACNRPTQSATPPPPADSFQVEPFDVHLGELIEKVSGATVTSAFFRKASVLPLLGREFLDGEYGTPSARVVVIAASFWQRRFSGDPARIGRTLQINERQYTIVGICRRRFSFQQVSKSGYRGIHKRAAEKHR